MKKGIFCIISMFVVVSNLFCTAESIGRSADRDYDRYMNNRSREQEKRDQIQFEEANEFIMNRPNENDQEVRKFNESVKFKPQKTQDGSDSLTN